MNIKKISQEVAKYVENLLSEELNNEIVNDSMSLDYQKTLDEEQSAFEDGIVDDELDIEMEEADINKQTMEFLKLRGKK